MNVAVIPEVLDEERWVGGITIDDRAPASFRQAQAMLCCLGFLVFLCASIVWGEWCDLTAETITRPSSCSL